MKNLFKIAALTAAAAFTFTACNKDQKVVNRLEGDWNLTTLKEYENGVLTSPNNGLIPGETIIFGFEKCKLKSDDFCDFTIKSTENGNTETESYKYKISDDGETFVWDVDYNSNTTTDQQNWVITESTKKNFKISMTEINGSDTYKTEFGLEPK